MIPEKKIFYVSPYITGCRYGELSNVNYFKMVITMLPATAFAQSAAKAVNTEEEVTAALVAVSKILLG